MTTTPQELELIHNKVGAVDIRRDFNIEDVFRYAIEHQGTAETLEKLMSIRRELNAEQAKKAFDEALAAFQSECPVIEKKKFGAKQAYRYAELDKIVTAVQPLLRKYGFSFSLTSEIEKDWVKAIVKLTHSGGHHEFSEFKVPIDARNVMMNDPQKYAGSMTFAKRYCFCNALGIMTADSDEDGATVKPKPQGPSSVQPTEQSLKDLARELWNVLAPVRGTEKNWKTANQWLWDEMVLDPTESAPDLTAPRFKAAIADAKEKLK